MLNNLHGKCNHITLHVFSHKQVLVHVYTYMQFALALTASCKTNQTCQTLVQINSIQLHIMHLYDGYCSKCQILGIA